MDHKLNLFKAGSNLPDRLQGLDSHPQWEALMEYLSDQEKGATNIILGLSDMWESHMWDRKIAQAKGMLILIAMLRALPKDSRTEVEARAKKLAETQ